MQSTLLAMESRSIPDPAEGKAAGSERGHALEYCWALKEEGSCPEIHNTAETATGTIWWFLAQGLIPWQCWFKQEHDIKNRAYSSTKYKI